MPGRAVCPALGPRGRWTPWHANRPPGASGGANEVGPRIRLPAVAAQEPSWLVECLRLGVGHASTVRPDPSTLGVVGDRGSRREGRSPARPRPLVMSPAPPKSVFLSFDWFLLLARLRRDSHGDHRAAPDLRHEAG